MVRVLAAGAALVLQATLTSSALAEAVQDASPNTPRAELAPDSVFQEGLRLLEENQREEALNLWEDASEDPTVNPDPRVGIAFLETVVEEEDEGRYDLAFQVFLWGLSGVDPNPFRSTVLEELDRILPILNEEETPRWTALKDSSTVTIARELRGFWIQKDPTPTTPLNERLIEHWQRILFARANYRYSIDPPYGTDDRGIIYVKYGAPGREKSGFLGAAEVELLVRVPNDPTAREAMRRYDSSPQYEVWVYEDLNPSDFVQFLFGNEGGKGRFRLVDGVRDLIPTEAWSQASARYTPGGVPVAHYLELFYYQDLSALGGRFARRFSELDEVWNLYTHRRNPASGGVPAPSQNTLRAYSYRYDMQDRSDPESPPTVAVVSAYEGGEREEIVVQAVRTLQENEPRLVITALSASRLGVRDRSGLRRQRLEAEGFEMSHTLIVRDSLHREVGRLTERATSAQGDVSTFFLRHPEEAINLTVTGETRRGVDEEDSEPQIGPPYPGQAHLRPLAPLNTDPDHLEVSDLATGVRIPEALDVSGFLFPLLPTPKIWLEDPLLVYLEVYHLALDALGTGRFRADFRIVPLRDDGTDDTARSPVTLSVDLESEGPTFGRSFFINLYDQELGYYRVEVEVTDLLRGETRSRTAQLEIMG